MAVNIFKDRTDDEETLVLEAGTSIGMDSSIKTDEIISSSTPETMITVTTPDMPSVGAKKDARSTKITERPNLQTTIQNAVVEEEEEEITTDAAADTPKGDRWAVAAPGVDLSGKWELIVTDEFKKSYDRYLAGLGQPRIVRSVALSGPVIGQTMEELIQIDQGRSLMIHGKNVRGTWDRTLVASGSTKDSADFDPLITPIRTVDQELVQSEAWWEEEGTVHVSWMRGVTMYGGGSFYSRRHLEKKKDKDDETVYVC